MGRARARLAVPPLGVAVAVAVAGTLAGAATRGATWRATLAGTRALRALAEAVGGEGGCMGARQAWVES